MKRWKRYGRRIAAAVLAGCLCFSIQASATETEDELRRQQRETQQQLNEINQQMKSIEGQRDEILEEINTLDSELTNVILTLELLEADLAIKQEDLEAAQQEYEAAKQREEAQYEAMKLRIQYIYEQGETDYLSLLLQAESFVDFLNKKDFSQEIHEQDRKLLTDYQEVKEEVAMLVEQIEQEKKELEVLQSEQEAQKAEVERMLAEKQAQEANFENQLEEAQRQAQVFKSKIAEQNAQIRKLEAERRRKEAEAAAASGNGGGSKNPGVSGGGGSIAVTGNSSLGRSIANYALQFRGGKYVFGGTSLSTGVDCSGFTRAVFRNFGISLPRDSTSQRSAGRGVSYSEAQAGDIICYAGHVAIYLGGGQIVHAADEKHGITTGSATYQTILAVRRCY